MYVHLLFKQHNVHYDFKSYVLYCHMTIDNYLKYI